MRSIVIFLIVMMPWICCIAAELPTKTAASEKNDALEKSETLDDMFSLYEPYLANIGPYKPVYFLLGANFRFASKGTSMQLDMTYPLSMGFFRNLDFYFHIQYVDALAETLLNYTERTEALRVGLAIVR